MSYAHDDTCNCNTCVDALRSDIARLTAENSELARPSDAWKQAFRVIDELRAELRSLRAAVAPR